jgi:hypothetical protein
MNVSYATTMVYTKIHEQAKNIKETLQYFTKDNEIRNG